MMFHLPLCRISELMTFVSEYVTQNVRINDIDLCFKHKSRASAQLLAFRFARCALLKSAYEVTSSRSRSSRSAVALMMAFTRNFGLASGKNTVIGTPKNRASISNSEIDGL